MKTRRTILLFGGLAISVVTAIFIWQLRSLSSLSAQLEAGFHGSLEAIAGEAALELNAEFEARFFEPTDELVRVVAAQDSFREKALMPEFYRITAQIPLQEAWVLVEANGGELDVVEYKQPSRYLRESTASGSWRRSTNLTQEVGAALRAAWTPGTSLATLFDDRSRLYFRFPRAFGTDLLVGIPAQRADSSTSILLTQLSRWQFEEVFLPQFFQEKYWTDAGTEREGLEKKHLKFGVVSDRGDRLVYNSVAFDEQFEHRRALGNRDGPLAGYALATGFRGESVAAVAHSIYQRNVYFIVGMYLLLLGLLFLIFRSSRRLLRLSRLKTEFVANVSHEIKTPLASIRLATDTLRLGRAATPEQLQPIVGILDQETHRLQHLIRTLLDFSSLESGQRRYEWQTLPTTEYIGSVRDYFAGQSLPDLGLEATGDPVGHVRIDQAALEQVCGIFLDNARKYSPDDPRLHLEIRAMRDRLRIGLRDHGIGIAQADQAAIFERFVRVGNVDEHNVQGHGIGLSMARAIVRDHGGRIGVESTPGEGSCFYFELPLKLSP